MKSIFNLARSFFWLRKYDLVRKIYQENQINSEFTRRIISKVNDCGVQVIPDFFSKESCNEIVEEIDRLMIDFAEYCIQDNSNSDSRIFGANYQSVPIQSFYSDLKNRELREQFHRLEDKDITGIVMANRVRPKPNNLGSGGGWHRDSVKLRDMKVMLYLNDVTEKNGAFQYVKYSHGAKSVLEGLWKHNFSRNKNRFTSQEVESILLNQDYQLDTLESKAGTLVVFDVSGIHRGKPIETGERYALTNYYWVSEAKGGNSGQLRDLPGLLPLAES